MCGRFGLFVAPEVLEQYFALTEFPDALAPPRYNLTPGQAVAVVRQHEGRRRLDSLQWGLIPFWATDPTIGRKLVNARLDSIATKPAFREAWTRRRCLIPASGFYEWSEPVAGRKRPHFIRPRDEPLLAIAGLWERWRSPSGEKHDTCVIVTTDATAQLAPIHDRMPVLIPRDAFTLWLDPQSGIQDVTELAARAPALDAQPVGFAVNDPRKDDETLIVPLAETGTG